MQAIKKLFSMVLDIVLLVLAIVLLVLVAVFVMAPSLVIKGISPKSAFTKWVLVKVIRVLDLLEAALEYLKGK